MSSCNKCKKLITYIQKLGWCGYCGTCFRNAMEIWPIDCDKCLDNWMCQRYRILKDLEDELNEPC